MSVDDFCRFCRESLRIKGILSNTRKIFECNKLLNEKSVCERLGALGLVLVKDRSRSCRICRSCCRLLVRMESDFAVFRRWQEAETEPVQEAATSTDVKPYVEAGFIKVEKREIDISPPETPSKRLCPSPPSGSPTPAPTSAPAPCQTTVTRKLSRPTTEMPTRRSQTEVLIHYPSQRVEKFVCKANTGGIVENITKENWRTAANLLVRHKELFGHLKHIILKVIEDESKTLCNPYKGFMLWRTKVADLKAFSFANLLSDLQRMSPFIFSILSLITNQSPYTICAAAAVALRGREPRLAAFAYYIDSVLQYGGAKKDVFKRLSKLGITTSHSCALVKQKEFTDTCGEQLRMPNVDNEILFDLQNDDEDTDDSADEGPVHAGFQSLVEACAKGLQMPVVDDESLYSSQYNEDEVTDDSADERVEDGTIEAGTYEGQQVFWCQVSVDGDH